MNIKIFKQDRQTYTSIECIFGFAYRMVETRDLCAHFTPADVDTACTRGNYVYSTVHCLSPITAY